MVARLLWEQDVAGSNPVIPMGFKVSDLGQPQTSPESPITEYAEPPLEIGCFYRACTASKWVMNFPIESVHALRESVQLLFCGWRFSGGTVKLEELP